MAEYNRENTESCISVASGTHNGPISVPKDLDGPVSPASLSVAQNILIQDKEPTTDQSIHTAKVQLSEPSSFIGVTCRHKTDGLHTQRAITQRQMPHLP